MKKSKFVKAIAAFTMSAVAAAGCISLVACGGHSHHTSKEGWQGSNATQHWHVCDEDGEKYGHHDHVWGDDTVCDECDYDSSTGPVGPGPGPGPDVPGDSVVIYENDFTEDATVECIGTGEEVPATGIYGTVSGNPVDFTENNSVSISGGKLNVLDKSGETTNAYVKVDTVKYKTVHISGKLTPTLSKVAGSWSMVRVLGENNKDLADIRTNSDKKVQLYDGGAGTFSGSAVSYASGTEYAFEITLDLVSGTASLKFGSTTVVENQTITGLKGASFTGIMFITAGSDSRDLAIDDLTISTKDSELATLKEVLDADLDALYAKLTEVEGAYTEENKTTLDQKYAGGVAAIEAATTNDAVIEAYETAVEELNAVETKSATALKDLKEERVAAINALVEENSSKYTINKAAYDKAVEDGIANINAATVVDTEEESVTKGVWAAYKSAVTAINAVDKDETAYPKKVSAAKTAVSGYVDAEKYTGKATELQAVIDKAVEDIDAVTVEDGNYTAAVEAINAIVAKAKEDINAIPSDAQLLAAEKETALTTLSTYKDTEIGEISTEWQSVIDDIAEIKTVTGVAAINEQTTVAKVNEKLAEIQASIDRLIASTQHADLATAKTGAIANLTTYVNGVIGKLDATNDADLITAINEAKTAGETAINAVEETENLTADINNVNDELTKAENAIKALVDANEVAKDKVAKCALLDAYATTAKGKILSNGYKGKIDTTVVAEKAKINAETVTTLAGVQAAYDAAKVEVDKLVNACIGDNVTATFTVTFDDTNLPNGSVKYGESVVRPATNPTKEDASFVNWYKDADLTELYEFSDVVYDDITIYAKYNEPNVTLTFTANDIDIIELRGFSGQTLNKTVPVAYASALEFDHWEFEDGTPFNADTVLPEEGDYILTAVFNGYKPNEKLALEETWLVEATDKVENNLVKESKLFVVNWYDADVVQGTIEGKKGKPSAKLLNSDTATTFTAGLQSSNVTTDIDYSLKPLRITAKENITLYAYVAMSDSKFSSGRTGDIVYQGGNIIETIEVAGDPSVKTITIELQASETLTVYIENPNNGSRLWLFGVEAELSEEFTNATIKTVVEGTEKDLPWSSLKAVTAPDSPVVEGKSFDHWSATEGGDEYDAFGTKMINPGEELKLYAVFKTADVTVNFYNEDGTPVTGYTGIGAVSGKPFTASKPADPKKDGYTFAGWYEKTDGEYKATAYDFSSNLVAGTLNLYAKFDEIQSNYQTVGFTNAQLPDYITTINAQRTDDNKYIDEYDIISIMYDSDVSNKKCGTVNSIFGGQIGTASRNIKIDLSKYEGTATVTLGVVHSSGIGRQMFITEGSPSKTLCEDYLVVATTAKNNLDSDSVELECGKVYYVGADSTVFLGEITVYLDVNAVKA